MILPIDIINIIVEYAWEYTDFKDWIDKKKINWSKLSSSPNAINIIKKYPRKIIWSQLCCNPSPGAIHILEENLDKIDWKELSRNPNIFKDNKKELSKVLLNLL